LRNSNLEESFLNNQLFEEGHELGSYFGAAPFWQQTVQLMRSAQQDNIYVGRMWKQLSLTALSKLVSTSIIAIGTDRSLLSHDDFLLLSYRVKLVQITGFSDALAVYFFKIEMTKRYFQRV
jgi:hypothetical protein